MKKTEWFPGRIKPALSGVYERDYPNVEGAQYCYYDATIGKWYVPADSTPLAADLGGLNDCISMCPDLNWRGITPNT